MPTPSVNDLTSKKCLPCEGGVPAISPEHAVEYLHATPRWNLDDEGKAIYRKINCKHFVNAMRLLNQVADIAESEQHHPDLHLTGYRNVRIELTTHAIGGLSENDFILAAKIDQIVA
ncbi:MAG: 4a-hydroxytetrahydrobiopterin dehydratase [Rubripirellula sp.]|nr:4a-hydroxytetrahydrobiopterin dehydratase [Rubripirellula sp.]